MINDKMPIPPLSRMRQAVDNDEPVGWGELKRWLRHLLNLILWQTIRETGGQIITIGSKQWVYFEGSDSELRAQMVITAFEAQFGYKPSFAGLPSREDDDYDYAIRLD